MKKILLFLVLLNTALCFGQEEKSPISIEDLNIPQVVHPETITYGQTLLENDLVNFNKRDSVVWQKIVIRATEEEELERVPYGYRKYETIIYWDTTFVEYTNATLNLVTDLYESALKGNIRTYSFDTQQLYDENDLVALLRIRDTVKLANNEKLVMYNYLSLYSVSKAVVIEEWYQTRDGKVRSELLAVAPMFYIYDDNGDYRGFKILCWFVL